MAQPRRYESPAKRQAAYRERQATARDAQLKAKGLPPLPVIGSMPGDTRWSSLIQQATWALQTAAEEMDNYFEDRSPKWQDDERGERFRERIDEILGVLESVKELGG